MPFKYSELCTVETSYRLARDGNLTRADFEDADMRHSYLEDILSVCGGLLCFCLLLLFFFLYNRRWRRRSEMYEKATGVLKDSRTFALQLVAAFMPSWNLDRYQFRGMQPKCTRVSLEFKDLSLTLRHNGKTVLNGVTGKFGAARMCAIMGPSGAGKTTFMNVLCGKATYGTMGGEVKVNGAPASVKDIKSITGFVPQDDIVHEHLTVREQIQFSAQLRNSSGTSLKRIERITEDVLNVMQVSEIQNSIVGSVEQRGISGGQRKRVNIGLELAAQPTVLFLDEPTSGLDSSSSVAVCASLKKMTQLGMSSVMVIHQPRFSLFTLFDDVLLLGKGGSTVYLGPSTLAKDYFESRGFQMPENENPADWFMDIIAGELDKNAQAPEGYKPSMLFDLWDNRFEETSSPLLRQMTQLASEKVGRDIDVNDDHLVLTSKLEEHWDNIDINKDGVMEPDELKVLLTRCSQMEPPDAVVEEMMVQMSGAGVQAVTKSEFVEYLCSLRGTVATDRSVIEEAMYQSQGSGSTDADLEQGGLRRALTLEHLNRKLPGFWGQLRVLNRRQLCAWWRASRMRCVFLAALALGAIVLALQDKLVTDSPAWQVTGILNTHMALALLISIFALGLFGGDRPVFWRESSNGLNIPAHFLARVLANWVDLLMFTFVYTALYYLIAQPLLPYPRFAFPYLLVTFVAAGWGYLISALAPPQHGAFIVSLIVFVTCGLLGNPTSLSQYMTGGPLEYFVDFVSITRWSVDLSFMIFWEREKPIPHGNLETQMYCLGTSLFNTDSWGIKCVVILLCFGLVLHVLAFLGIRLLHRDKQV